MKKRIKSYVGIGLICLFLFGCAGVGCGKKEIVVEAVGIVEEEAYTGAKKESGTEARTEAGAAAWSRDETGDRPKEEAGVEDGGPAAEADDGGEEEKNLTAKETSGDESEGSLWVHICGEVLLPGVYELPAKSRICDAIRAAGGVTGQGDEEYLNQASLLADGMKITVPSVSEVKEWKARGETGIQEGLFNPTAGSDSAQGSAAGTEQAAGEDGRININTADEAALCTLPGIGSSRARSIIAYREENGPFSRIEDIMKVNGIKEGAFAKLKEYIKVS